MTEKTRSLTVSGDLGKWSKGQVLTTDAEIVQYYRDSFDEGEQTGASASIPDDRILAIFDEFVKETYEDASDLDVMVAERMEEEVKASA